MKENGVALLASFGETFLFGFGLETMSFDHVVCPPGGTVIVAHPIDDGEQLL